MERKTSTLINQLEDIVDPVHIQQVKQLVMALSKINNFKYGISENPDVDFIYKKISNILKEEFDIKDFKITSIINKVKTTKYKTKDEVKFNYEFISKVNKNTKIKFLLNIGTLSDFNKTYLDSYLEEMSHVLYVQSVLLSLKESKLVDPLTKLKNRISLYEDMKALIPLALREKMKIGVLLVNIDRFRAVNDEHGTKFGDEFLKLYADTIKNSIRTSDIAIRFSGGEFLVLLINVIDEEKTIQLANELKEKLSVAHLETQNGDKFKKTVCIGVSMFPKDSIDFHEIVKNSEMALIDAKDKGRGQIVRYEEESGELDLF